MRLHSLICTLLIYFLPHCLFAQGEVNQLTRAEQVSGWELLFDGKTAEHFRNYKKDSINEKWTVEAGALTRSENGAGDIITKEKYKSFELSIEYNIERGGNSGIMFHVDESSLTPWMTGPEIQVLCNETGKDPQRAGWLYQLYTPRRDGGEILDATRPAGQWNQVYLRISPTGCEVCLNGQKYYNFTIGDANWNDRVAKSKFAKMPKFGKTGEGHICLQDHGDRVAYRNIKVRRLKDDGSLAKSPADGKLNVRGELAFPNLNWPDYEAVDENGKVNKQLRIVEITHAKSLPHRLFAVSQTGVIYTFENRPDVELAQVVLDLREVVSKWWPNGAFNEQGLLGLAFHPKFSENGQFFVNYTRLADDTSVISRFRMSQGNPLVADRDSEEVLLEVAQPFKNHNGGSLEFGPDGFLYIGFGDGGLRDDPHNNGLNLETLLATVLRIDVDRVDEGRKYGIPADNPFVNTPNARPEIYAFGLRNPWKIAFDSQTGRLWLGDVGQELWEEIDIIEKGGNYGWSHREGSKPFSNRPPHPSIPEIDPVWEYDHQVGKSITGGRVYRSKRLPQLEGKYVFADYVSGRIWGLSIDEATGKATRCEEIADGGNPVLVFGEDESGEVYYAVDNGHAKCIYKFVSH